MLFQLQEINILFRKFRFSKIIFIFNPDTVVKGRYVRQYFGDAM